MITANSIFEEISLTLLLYRAKKFRDLVKSRGYKFEDGKLTLSEENSDEDDKAGVAGDGAARKTSKKAVKGEVVKCTPKKRKIKKESVDDDEDDKWSQGWG